MFILQRIQVTWNASLKLDFINKNQKTVCDFLHLGPLRVLKSLYPEGDKICHTVLIHVPGGLVGGDLIQIELNMQDQTHALITNPGATRFYKTNGQLAQQNIQIKLGKQAFLEWMPLENIAYNNCLASNKIQLELAEGAQALVWDVTALGLKQSNLPFVEGQFEQEINLNNKWLEKAIINGLDQRLMQSEVGLNGFTTISSLYFFSGSDFSTEQRQAILDQAYELIQASGLSASAGVTSPHSQVVVVRVLSPTTETSMNLLKLIWASWRKKEWGLSAQNPRLWSM